MKEAGAPKAAIRADLRRQRQALAPEWVAETSAAIARRVAGLPEFEAAETVLCYLALPEEVQTEGLIRAAWAAGKRVAVPAFRAEKKEYAAAWIEPGQRLVAGRWNVPEPAAPDWVAGERLDAGVIPGVAFVAGGTRLGHGQGWFDRLLSRIGAGVSVKIGVGFDFQVVASLPGEPHDVDMDIVVTEKAVYRPRPGRRNSGGFEPARERKT